MFAQFKKAVAIAAVSLAMMPAVASAASVAVTRLVDLVDPIVPVTNPSPTSVTSVNVVPVGTLAFYDNVTGDQFVDMTRVARDPFETTTLAGVAVFSSVSRTAAATYDIPAGSKGLSFIWGSPDSHNRLTLSFMGSTVFSIKGDQIAALSTPVALIGARAVFVSITDVVFDSIELSSALNAFEFANLKIDAIPLPAAGWMLVSAMVGMGLLGRSRNRAAA